MVQEPFVLLGASLPQRVKQPVLSVAGRAVTIEQAVQRYLQEQRTNGRRAKTMEWHQTALRFFQQYLQGERHLALLTEITAREVRTFEPIRESAQVINRARHVALDR